MLRLPILGSYWAEGLLGVVYPAVLAVSVLDGTLRVVDERSQVSQGLLPM
jgi:hypothetical protein